MARSRIENCVICGRHVDECGPLSARKRCEDCGAAQVDRAARQLIAKKGPAYEAWKLAMIKQAEETLAALRDGNG